MMEELSLDPFDPMTLADDYASAKPSLLSLVFNVLRLVLILCILYYICKCASPLFLVFIF